MLDRAVSLISAAASRSTTSALILLEVNLEVGGRGREGSGGGQSGEVLVLELTSSRVQGGLFAPSTVPPLKEGAHMGR